MFWSIEISFTKQFHFGAKHLFFTRFSLILSWSSLAFISKLKEDGLEIEAGYVQKTMYLVILMVVSIFLIFQGIF